MSKYVTARELGGMIGLCEETVYNRLMNAGIIKKADNEKGYEILEKKREHCRVEFRNRHYRIVFDFEEIRHYTAGMYRHKQM